MTKSNNDRARAGAWAVAAILASLLNLAYLVADTIDHDYGWLGTKADAILFFCLLWVSWRATYRFIVETDDLRQAEMITAQIIAEKRR